MERMDSQKAIEWDDKLTRPLPGQFVDEDEDWATGQTIISEDSTF